MAEGENKIIQGDFTNTNEGGEKKKLSEHLSGYLANRIRTFFGSPEYTEEMRGIRERSEKTDKPFDVEAKDVEFLRAVEAGELDGIFARSKEISALLSSHVMSLIDKGIVARHSSEPEEEHVGDPVWTDEDTNQARLIYQQISG